MHLLKIICEHILRPPHMLSRYLTTKETSLGLLPPLPPLPFSLRAPFTPSPNQPHGISGPSGHPHPRKTHNILSTSVLPTPEQHLPTLPPDPICPPFSHQVSRLHIYGSCITLPGHSRSQNDCDTWRGELKENLFNFFDC